MRNDCYPITKHSTLRYYKKYLGNDLFLNLYKFATIRNPWDMMVSFYYSPHFNISEWCRNDFIKLLNRVKTLRQYISTNEENDIQQEIDYLIRFERLNEEFSKVCKLLNITIIKLPVRNKSSRRHYSYYYDDELIEMVRKKFWEEIEYGRYTYESQ